MDDPILRHVAQPLVDATGVDPRALASTGSAAFLACALVASGLRIATVQGDGAGAAMQAVGAVIVAGWMRRCAADGILCHIQPWSLVHLAMRLALAGCGVLDAVAMLGLVAADAADVQPVQFIREGLQIGVDALGAATLYLTACRTPPPRRPRARRAFASTG